MSKVVEIKETITDSNLVENIESIKDLINKLDYNKNYLIEINKNDYDYLNISTETIRLNLEKMNTFVDTILNQQIEQYNVFYMYN